ncbi:filaggrin-2-like [Vombatus ursinus]|uniref:filaggrin-2-like n=1 Tax=Vombatus ursinus TaxID=29139 RepID=UPI000FFD2917|nr:filaggrin-2-like [Vombatus ursinus]
MSHLLTSIATILDVFYQYCGQDEECDTMSQSELKELLENELQFILENPGDCDTVDVIMLNLDRDQNRRIDFTEFLLMIFKLTMAFNKTFKKEYRHGHHEDLTETEEEEDEEKEEDEEEKWGESKYRNSSRKTKEEDGTSRTGKSQDKKKIMYRCDFGEREKQNSQPNSKKKGSKKANHGSILSKSGKRNEDKHECSSSKKGERKRNSRTRHTTVKGGETYETDTEISNEQGENRWKRTQENGSKKAENDMTRQGQSVTFEGEEEKYEGQRHGSSSGGRGAAAKMEICKGLQALHTNCRLRCP